MTPWLQSLAHLWVRRIHPRLLSFVATMGLLGLGACLLILLGLAHLADEVLEQEAFWFDERLLLWLHQFANPALDRGMLAVTRLGNPGTVIPLAGMGLGWLCWRRQGRTAAVFAIACGGGAILSLSLKLLFGKARPRLWPPLITETTYSFPSGHALGSMVLYGLLAYLLVQRYPRRRPWIYGGATLLVGAIGLSRLYLGVHWPTDVLAGYGVGFLWLQVCIALLRLGPPLPPPPAQGLQ